eukprot:TRINITY_DN8082_c0_g1_i19.p1 TRINITY_DN8082_c0_g1~~TRINITY_DN8082_c0_g1_i19.p1  ORF type:complete len:370 (-),score=46.36 TRINITY_DN8082_c0_g1_i19:221-1330(-)
MYYIRLDSIVTVVDAERLGYSLVSGDSHFGVSAMSQIINSDVIVLNKTDILSSEAMEIVKKYISEISPHSKVIPTEYCQVPLQFILDIQDVTTGSQGVSHDRSNILYKVSPTGKGHRTQPEKIHTHNHNCNHDHNRDHIALDTFTNVLFESHEPFILWKFQEFLKKLGNEVLRIKGLLYFNDCPSHRYVFHQSGRQRFELLDDGCWDTNGAIHLVLIGRNLSQKTLLHLLNQVVVSDYAEDISQMVDRNFISLIQSNERFEVKQDHQEQTTVLIFRLTGYKIYGMSKEKAVKLHGISINNMNEIFQKRINSANGSWFLACEIDEDNQFWLKFQPIGCSSFQLFYDMLVSESDEVLELFFGNICGCKRHW